MNINVGTYNIWHAQDYSAHLRGERKIAPENIAKHIYENDIAICGIEEVDVKNKRSDHIDTTKVIVDELAEMSGEKYYYAYASAINDYANRGSRYGNALISRYPILNTREVMVDMGMGIKDGYEPRVILAADLDVQGRALTVIVTHFGLNESERELAAERLGMLLKETENPVIFMGDLNTTPNSDIYCRIAELLCDCSEDNSLPLTFSSNEPKYKIDYIFRSRELKTSNIRTNAVEYSDHLPLTVTLEW